MMAEDQSTAALNSSAQSITNFLLVQGAEEPASNTEASSAVLDASEPSGQPDASEEGQNNDAKDDFEVLEDDMKRSTNSMEARADGNSATRQ